MDSSTTSFVQLVSDSFQRANENPLNPAAWSELSAEGYASLQIVSDQCVATVLSGVNVCAEQYSGILWPNDQWVEVQIGALAGAVDLWMRTDVVAQTTGYSLEIDGTAGYYHFDLLDCVTSTFIWSQDFPGLIPKAGDRVRLAFYGATWTLYLNGVVLGSGTNSSTPSGTVLLMIVPNASVTDTSVTQFLGGQVTAIAVGMSAPTKASQPSVITYLQLDADNDPIFDPRAALVDAEAVEQAILTRLLLFQGEWWENLNEGTPYFQQILGKRGSVGGQQIMSLALAQRINGTPYVTAAQNVSAALNPESRQFSFSCTAQTAFGPVSVSNSPASAASLGD